MGGYNYQGSLFGDDYTTRATYACKNGRFHGAWWLWLGIGGDGGRLKIFLLMREPAVWDGLLLYVIPRTIFLGIVMSRCDGMLDI